MCDIKPANISIRNADTFEKDWPMIDEYGNYEHLQIDVVISNPPHSQTWNTENKQNNPKYSQYGVVPKSTADYAFLLHDLYHVKNNGLMTIVLSHGVFLEAEQKPKLHFLIFLSL